MHSIRTDHAAGIIEVEVTGFWSEDHVGVFAQDLAREAQAVAATGKRHAMFCDYSRAAIQTQQVVAAIQSLAVGAEYKSRKVALFTAGLLARQQAKRIAAMRPDIAVFTDHDAAMDWLAAE